MVPFNEAAKANLVALAAEHAVSLTWTRSWSYAHSWAYERCATAPVIQRPRDWLVGLHELGHVLNPASRRLNGRWDCGGELACEIWAWAWAIENGDPALLARVPQRDWELVGQSVASYMAWHGRNRPADGGAGALL